VFQSPPAPMTLFYTDYSIRSAIFALNSSGFFSRTITNNDLPPNSPYKLSTNDFYFRLFVPGLAGYPNMNITVGTLLKQYSITITPKGIKVEPEVFLNFNLINTTKQHPGWVLLFDIAGNLNLSTTINKNTIQVSSAFSDWNSNTTLISTSVGNLSASAIGNLLQTLIQILLKLPTENVTVISGFTVSQTAPLFYTEFGGISTQISYATAPALQCGDGITKCALRNTCCKWNKGWGCCTLPSASCCSDTGCCPQGSVCDGGECYSVASGVRLSSAFHSNSSSSSTHSNMLQTNKE